jgi:malonyl-CoA O-methyltransferase
MNSSAATSAPSSRVDAAALARYLRRVAKAGEPPWLHAEAGRRMGDKLDAIRARPKAVTDWWSHLGASRDVWAQRYPQASVCLVEPTRDLAARTREAVHLPWWRKLWPARRGPVTTVFEASDAAMAPPAELLWANMMLHWVDDIPALFGRWHRALAPQGFLMFSSFGPDTVRELSVLYASMGWTPPTIAFTDMHDLGDMLVHAGFAEPVMDMEHLTLTWPNAKAMLAELRALGINARPDRPAGLRTPAWHRELTDALTTQCRNADGRLQLSFELVYGHAFRGATPTRDGETRVALGDLRAALPSQRGPR